MDDFHLMLLQDLKLCWLPFQTHDSEVENGGDCQHVLHVVDKLAHESTKSPRKGKQFGQLKKIFIVIFLSERL